MRNRLFVTGNNNSNANAAKTRKQSLVTQCRRLSSFRHSYFLLLLLIVFVLDAPVAEAKIKLLNFLKMDKKKRQQNKANGSSETCEPCVCPPEDTTYIQLVQKERENELQEHNNVLTDRVLELQKERDVAYKENLRLVQELQEANEEARKLKEGSNDNSDEIAESKLKSLLQKCQDDSKQFQDVLNKDLADKVMEHQMKYKALKSQYQQVIDSLKEEIDKLKKQTSTTAEGNSNSNAHTEL